MNKKKIVILTGAGVSQESGIETFRDIKDGLWYNYNVEMVATDSGWKNNPELVLEFHNMLRDKCADKEPNDAHKALVRLEEDHEVTLITQNVDNLHEKAGSTNILHIHGELFKARDSFGHLKPCTVINMGDLDDYDEQLRPHTVLFGEMPFNMNEAMKAIDESDILIVVGTSFSIHYIPTMVSMVEDKCQVYYVDPQPDSIINHLGIKNLDIRREKASEGVSRLVDEILSEKKVS